MKKKLIASLLAASMLLTLSACGKDGGTPDSKPASAAPTEQTTDSGPATDAPDEAVTDNAAPVNGIQLYNGSYLDLDGEYASGVPCRRMGGSEIAASDTTVSAIYNIGMNPNEGNYQKDVIAETYQWDINVTNSTPFIGIPAGAETYWTWNMTTATGFDIAYANEKTEEYKANGAELKEPGETGLIMVPAGRLGCDITTANETSEPIDKYHFSPIIFCMYGSQGWENHDDDTSGKPGGYACIGDKVLHNFDDIIAAYGEPMGVYGTKESNITYVWKATGDADVYVLARYNAQAEHPGIDIYYIKDCEVSKSLIENGDFVNIPDNLYDILSELGLYTE